MLRNSRKFLFFFLLWLTVAAVFVASEKPSTIQAQSATVEARVTSVNGAATISGGNRTGAKLLRGATLAPGDEIDTRGGGRVVIDLTDGSQVVVLPGSHLVIGSYQNASSLRELLQITLGRIRVRINHFKGKPNPYRIKSPTASIAVRGTEFEVSVEPLGETRVVVLNGLVEVSSLRDPKNPLIAEPGRNVIVRPNFTIDFFTVDALNREVGEREKQKSSNAANQKNDDSDNSKSAANVYERSIESIVGSGETALPSRFAAFPDAYLDSLENPAYADSFTTAEGRFYLVPSLNGSRNAEDDLRHRFGLGSPRPVDYGFVPEAAVFVPLNKFRAVIGGSVSYVRSGLQSLTASENFPLNSPPFSDNTIGLRTATDMTTGRIFNGSLIFARRFGSRDRTSVGFSVERLFSRGTLSQSITQRDAGGATFSELTASRSKVNRTRLTFGVKHDFGSVRFGAFYRYTASAGSNIEHFRIAGGAVQPLDFIQTKGVTSELGFRLRGAFSRRLFYGAEATVLFGRIRETTSRSLILDSIDHDRTIRATLGFGLGYVLRPHTIFSFDVAGGLIGINQRTENSAGNLLETEREKARFLSLHAAVQTDVWRNFFASASVLSLTNWRTADKVVIPNRFRRTENFYTDIYSNFGIGYRFKPNLVFQYILTTDYGQTAPHHTFLLRYTFDFQHR